MAYIYHLTTRQEWEASLTMGKHTVPSLKEEGFIHCCSEEQVSEVVDRFYKDALDIVILKINTEKLRSQLVYEWSSSMEDTYPHVYGPINTDSVEDVSEVS
jgi:uncharacterized protein (DUF952 family)